MENEPATSKDLVARGRGRELILKVVLALLALATLGRWAEISLTSTRGEQQTASPDGHYVAKLSERSGERFFGGGMKNWRELRIESVDGTIVRHLETEDPSMGWPQDGVIKWTVDSSALDFYFREGDEAATNRRVTLLVKP